MVMTSTPAFNARSNPGDTRPPIASPAVMRKAHRLIREERPDDLLRYLEQQIAHFPQDAYLRLMAANTYAKIGDKAEEAGDFVTSTSSYKSALTHTLTGLVTKPNDVRLLCSAGRTLRMLGHYTESESFYQRALRRNNADPHIWSALGKLLKVWGNDKNAARTEDMRSALLVDSAACYATACQLDPESSRSQKVLAAFTCLGITGTPNGYDYRGGDIDRALLAIERFAARLASGAATGTQRTPGNP